MEGFTDEMFVERDEWRRLLASFPGAALAARKPVLG